jgi:hypothetical protein
MKNKVMQIKNLEALENALQFYLSSTTEETVKKFEFDDNQELWDFISHLRRIGVQIPRKSKKKFREQFN